MFDIAYIAEQFIKTRFVCIVVATACTVIGTVVARAYAWSPQKIDIGRSGFVQNLRSEKKELGALRKSLAGRQGFEL